MTPTLRDRVHAYLGSHTTLNLATDGPGGLWVAAVLYVYDGLHLYFTSVSSTRHGVNLTATGRAAGTVNDDCHAWEEMKGVQLEGDVDAVDELDERAWVAAAYLRKYPFAAALWNGVTDPERIADDPGSHGFFRLTPTRLLFTDNEHHPEGREELLLSAAP